MIVSDWPILRDYFSLGTVHISNSVEGVCEGVRGLREGTKGTFGLNWEDYVKNNQAAGAINIAASHNPPTAMALRFMITADCGCLATLVLA